MKRIVAAAVFAVLLMSAGGFANEWKYNYLKGMERFRDGDYLEAVRYLESAAKERTEDCVDCLREEGMFYTDYLPHYYLGLSYVSLRSFGKALANLEYLEKSGLIDRSKDLGSAIRLQYQTALKYARCTTDQSSPAREPRQAPSADSGKARKALKESVILSRFYGITVRMRYREGSEPYFEAEYEHASVRINLSKPDVPEGQFPSRALLLLQEWAVARRIELQAAWDELGQGLRPQVAPLD